jgi:hypothetical protein
MRGSYAKSISLTTPSPLTYLATTASILQPNICPLISRRSSGGFRMEYRGSSRSRDLGDSHHPRYRTTIGRHRGDPGCLLLGSHVGHSDGSTSRSGPESGALDRDMFGASGGTVVREGFRLAVVESRGASRSRSVNVSRCGLRQRLRGGHRLMSRRRSINRERSVVFRWA